MTEEQLIKQVNLLLRVAMSFSLNATSQLPENEKNILDGGADSMIEKLKTPQELALFVRDSLNGYVDDEQAFQKVSSLIGISAIALKKMEDINGRRKSS